MSGARKAWRGLLSTVRKRRPSLAMTEPTVYAVRLLPPAREAIDAERDRVFQQNGLDAAVRWLQAVDIALSSLAAYPSRCAVARESILLPLQVRQLLLPPRRPTGRLLFTVHEGGEEAPTVRVHLLRRTAQAPLASWPGADD